MQDFSPIIDYISAEISFNEQEKKLFISVLQIKKVKRKQFIEQPGFISRYRTFVINGALRAFFIGKDGQEHTISLAVDNGFIGDAGSFLFQKPATLFVEAMEDSTLIQWSYESEQLLLEKIPGYTMLMMKKSQEIAVMIQTRVISHLNLSAEQRYEEFAQKHPAFLQRFPLYIIASYLGMTREFLSKIRNQKIS
jgi:CRP-like cAMP-binding protein